MALPDDLLEQAGHLARRDRSRPRQANLRRAVSTAYYALFHLLTGEASRTMARTRATQGRIARAFKHSAMKRVCEQFGTGSAKLAAGLPEPLQRELRTVARVFVELQGARHEADYNLLTAFSRSQTVRLVQQARFAFDAWEQVRRSANAESFLVALLLEGR